jgi:beta-glucosidase
MPAGLFAQLRYRDTTKSVSVRVADLMKRMTPEEKIEQLESQMLFDPNDPRRDYTIGNVRDIAHFLHINGPVSAKGCATAVNEQTKRSIAASRFGIPELMHEEGLHGAQWGMATVFPQSIGMAASFDDSLYSVEANTIAQELRAVGIRQVLAPVINIARDPRWGRMQETYGEDVWLTSRMGVAYTKAMEQNGVIATPKHFVDNYGAGGHDSYASDHSWRELYENYMEPFRACVQEGSAQSIMPAYNSVDGVPCSDNSKLLTDILRNEWGFKGFTVSDYGAVYGVYAAHKAAASYADAQVLSLKAGMDVELANGYRDLDSLYQAGQVSIQDIDRAVRRVLTAKFAIGLYDHPYADTTKANSLVRNEAHRRLALRCARETMTLLKNERGLLPLNKDSIKTIGVFGPAANVLSLGDYTGPYGGWKGDGAVTPLAGLQTIAKAKVKLYHPGDDLGAFVKDCDAVIFFAAIQEGEAQDRSKLKLPSVKQKLAESQSSAVIAENQQTNVANYDQEGMIRRLAASGKKLVVVLQNGAPIDMSGWYQDVPAILEAWYPGEQGGTAIAETLFGDNNPGGKLPVSWPKNSGQVSVWYAVKPTGRSNSYIDDDGKPLFPFGYGLSYTRFHYSDLVIPQNAKAGMSLTVKVTVTNNGKMAGDEVIQLYLHRRIASVVRPPRELKAFKRVHLQPGQSKAVELVLTARSFGYYDENLHWTEPPGKFDLWISRNAAGDALQGTLNLN